MASRATQMLAAIKPHVPMIKFRKGVIISPTNEAITASIPVASKTIAPAEPTVTANEPTGNIKSSVQLHEWWETPFKFKRRQIDQLEIDVINSGGSDKLYC